MLNYPEKLGSEEADSTMLVASNEAFILQALKPLLEICEQNNLRMLRYLISMAADEADDIVRKRGPAGPKKGRQ